MGTVLSGNAEQNATQLTIIRSLYATSEIGSVCSNKQNMFIPFTFAMQNAKFEVLNYYSCQDEEGT